MPRQTELEWLPPYSWCPKIIGGDRPGYDCPMPVADGLYVNLQAHPYIGHIVGASCRTLTPSVGPHFTQLLANNHHILGLPPDVGQRWEWAQRAAQILELLPNWGLAKQLRGDPPPRFPRWHILTAISAYVDRMAPPPEGQTIDDPKDSRSGPSRMRAVLLRGARGG